jgi:hypothetical protein
MDFVDNEEVTREESGAQPCVAGANVGEQRLIDGPNGNRRRKDTLWRSNCPSLWRVVGTGVYVEHAWHGTDNLSLKQRMLARHNMTDASVKLGRR